VSERRTSNSHCVECEAINRHEFEARHPHRNAEYRRRYYARHGDLHKQGVRAWRKANGERYLAAKRAWCAANPERVRQQRADARIQHPPTIEQRRKDSLRAAAWNKEHRERRAVISRSAASRRRAALLKATPPWVDHKAINAIYAEAVRLTEATGVPHEVDHIEPLLGRDARGLHVPWNLRVITKELNRRKGNRRAA